MTKLDLNLFELQTMELGQSNSKLEILKNSQGEYLVKKYGSNTRSSTQFNKHKQALEKGSLLLKTPRILGEFDVKSNSYVMEYIRGNPLGIFINETSSLEMNSVSEIICSYIFSSFENQVIDYSLNSQFEIKLNIICNKLEEEQEMNNIFYQLAMFCKSSNHKYTYPSGWNHGDLSFENIIVMDNLLDIYGIDFLDSPFESPLIDFGRLWLDAKYGWWGSGYKETSNSLINRSILSKQLQNLASKLEVQTEIINLFTALAILRIRPYTKKALRLAYLKSAAKKILEGD